MDISTPRSPISLPEDDELFLDDAYARIIDLLECDQRPDPAILASARPHLLTHVHRLIQLARAVSPLQPARAPILPGYEVLSRLGAGGMGEVFLCRQTKMGGRLVAVKVLSEAFASSARRLDMLRDEAMALARLRHPGVVDVYEFVVGLDDDDNTVHAFAMQWIQGCSLAQWFAGPGSSRPLEPDHGAVPPRPSGGQTPPRHALMPSPSTPSFAMGCRSPLEFACRVLAVVAHTVHAVHREGLLHRDLKPSNILLREDGSPLVSDFGLARDLRKETGDDTPTGFSGTRAFASPEQSRGEPLDIRSDIYSLGMTLRHVLTASPPPDLDAIIAKATAPSPENRYATAADFAEDIERFLANRPVRANPPAVIRRCVMFLRRNRRATLGTSLGALCTLVLASAMVTAAFVAPRRAEWHLARARLELLSPGHANAIWNTEWFRNPEARFDVANDARQRSAQAYRAALRWRPWGTWSDSVRAELAVVERATAPPDDPRLRGLAAYLAGDSAGAIGSWSRLAAIEDPDAFIDGALGVLYLVREQHALAYPRLEHACSAFPRVGFLAAYHADAAVGCGDLDRAERLLNEAVQYDNQDIYRAALRVRADLFLAQGRLGEAQEATVRATLDPQTIAETLKDAPSHSAARGELLRTVLKSPVGASRLARIHAARGDFDSAASTLGATLARGMGLPSARSEYTSYVDRWWDSLSAPARREAIRRSIDLGQLDPASLAFRFRNAADGAPPEGKSSPAEVRQVPGYERPGDLWVAVFSDFLAFARPDSHTSLRRVSRTEMARRLEVQNMARWKRISAYSTTMKSWQLAAWMSPMPQSTSEVLAWIHCVFDRRIVPGGSTAEQSDVPATVPSD